MMTDCKTQFAKQKENYKQQDIKRKHSYTDTLSLSFTPPPLHFGTKMLSTKRLVHVITWCVLNFNKMFIVGHRVILWQLKQTNQSLQQLWPANIHVITHDYLLQCMVRVFFLVLSLKTYKDLNSQSNLVYISVCLALNVSICIIYIALFCFFAWECKQYVNLHGP